MWGKFYIGLKLGLLRGGRAQGRGRLLTFMKWRRIGGACSWDTWEICAKFWSENMADGSHFEN
jgi:hypothetical protein